MLEALARAINKRVEGVRASVDYDPYGLIIPTKEGGAHYYPNESSYFNSQFVDWGLDRLDELDCQPKLMATRGEWGIEINDTGDIRTASTKAECVAKALLAALGDV